MVTRKRKSRSSAAEVIDFLKEFSEKRERVEEELKSMQEEKKQFFADFFSYLNDFKK